MKKKYNENLGHCRLASRNSKGLRKVSETFPVYGMAEEILSTAVTNLSFLIVVTLCQALSKICCAQLCEILVHWGNQEESGFHAQGDSWPKETREER